MRRPRCPVGKSETTRHVHHRRQYSPPRHSFWVGRAVCAAALAGVVAVGLNQRQPAESAPHAVDVCATLQILAAATLYDRVPPPVASPDLEAFVTALNAEMSTVRDQIEESCRG